MVMTFASTRFLGSDTMKQVMTEEIREEREIREKRVSLEESIFNVLMFRYTVRIYIDRNQQTI